MSTQLLILIQVVIFGLIGPPFALYIGGENSIYYYSLTHGRDLSYVIGAYLSLLYAVILLIVLYFFFIRNTFVKYQKKTFEPYSYGAYYKLWIVSIVGTLICMAILLYQVNFSHPFFSSLSLDVHDYAQRRQELGTEINFNIYNIGLHVFAVLALTISFYFLKSLWTSFFSSILFLIFASISLAKSPIFDAILHFLIVVGLIKAVKTRTLVLLTLALLPLMIILFYVASKESSYSVILQTITSRIFLGEFSSLPVYLETFREHTAPLCSLYPPYVKSFFALDVCELPGKIIVNEIFPENRDIMGVANTFFPGSAFAYFGMFGIVLSPLLVFLNFYVVVLLFSRIQKNFINVFFFGYFLYRLSAGIMLGISYYIFSGIHIILMLFILYLFVNQSVIHNKRFVRQ